MNKAAARIVGIPGGNPATPLSAAELYPTWAYDLLNGAGMAALRSKGSWQGYSALRQRDGSEIPVWQLLVDHRGPDGKVEFISSIARDVTELKKVEEQLRQSQKMESLGLLAGGVAHDFNNLLQVIQGYTTFARRAGRSPEERERDLQQVMDAAEKAALLTRQLLAFGRRQPLQMADTDLSELVPSHLRLVRRVIGEHIKVDIVLGHGLGNVRCDRTQIDQVLLNLCVNARDSMPEGGRLTLELENVEIDHDFAAAHDWARPGRYALLSITDTGCGMDAATRERIFEPFFSTKPTGTGLGLSVVYGIVKQHGGIMSVYSEPGRGTTFKVYLPCADRREVEEKPSSAGEALGGNETILVAEDEPGVADLTRRILESAGYHVLVAGDGSEAVTLFSDHADEVSLLVLDVVMPAKGGRDALEEIRRVRPHVPALFLSGYAPRFPPEGQAGDRSPMPFIQKPCAPSELLRRVRAILDAFTTRGRS